jgi:hypothetical protein
MAGGEWKNWGSHPLVVIILVAGTLTGGLMGGFDFAEKHHIFEEKKSSANSDVEPSQRSLPQSPPVVSPPGAEKNPGTADALPSSLVAAEHDPAAGDSRAPDPMVTVRPSDLDPAKSGDDLLPPSSLEETGSKSPAPQSATATTNPTAPPGTRITRACPVVLGGFAIPTPGDWYGGPRFGGFRIRVDPRAGIYYFNPREIDPRSLVAGKTHFQPDVGFQRAARDAWLTLFGSPFQICIDDAGNVFGHFGPFTTPPA